jgi:hypothetical protein
MLNARRIATALSLGLLAIAAVGCTDDPAMSNNTANNNRVEEPVEAPDNGELLHVDPCVPGQANCLVELTTNNARDLEVKLVDENGQPVEDALISFEPDLGTSGITLGSANVYTNADGIAKTNVESGTDPGGAGTVTASTSNELVGTLKWTIGVSSKDSASYRVNFEHNGASQIKPIDVRLFADTVSCDDLVANPNQTAEYERQGLVDSAGVFPTVIFPNIANGDSYTVAAWGMFLDNSDVEVAYGCTDGNDPVQNGNPVDVTVTLVDHIPTITGEYAVTHEFDLTNALPDNVRTVVELIGRLATDPGSFVAGCPDSSTDPECPAGTDGLVDLLLDFLPSDSSLRDTIESALDSSIGRALVRDAVNSVADNWIDNSAPGWVRDTVNITGDIYKTLRKFRVEGVIRISEAPQVAIDQDSGDVVGVFAEGAGSQTWNDFIFFWSRGCENATDPDACSQRRFGARQLDMTDDDAPIQGTFSGTVFGSNELQINQHSLSLNYGALMVAIVEKVVLPEVFGTDCGPNDNLACDSLELALQEMISCQQVASWADSGQGTVYDVVENLCGSLLTQASDQLRDYASEQLVADGSEVFLIGTPNNPDTGEVANCTIHQPEVYQGDWEGKPLPYIQSLGTPDMKCDWDVRIKFSDDYTAEVPGTFSGDRTSFLNP